MSCEYWAPKSRTRIIAEANCGVVWQEVRRCGGNWGKRRRRVIAAGRAEDVGPIAIRAARLIPSHLRTSAPPHLRTYLAAHLHTSTRHHTPASVTQRSFER